MMNYFGLCSLAAGVCTFVYLRESIPPTPTVSVVARFRKPGTEGMNTELSDPTLMVMPLPYFHRACEATVATVNQHSIAKIHQLAFYVDLPFHGVIMHHTESDGRPFAMGNVKKMEKGFINEMIENAPFGWKFMMERYYKQK